MRKLRLRATLEHVKNAMDSLNQQDIKPTADNILTEIIQSSNGTVGSSKGTVLRFRRVLESLDSSTVKATQTVPSRTPNRTPSQRVGLDKSLLRTLESTLESRLEVQLWAKLEARFLNRLREQLAVYQVNKPHDQTHPESEDQATELKRQVTELQQVNEQLALENQELKAKLEALEQSIQTKDQEHAALKAEQIELEQTNQTKDEELAHLQSGFKLRADQLNQDLHELHELWFEAASQMTTPSASANTRTETDPLETYFQTLDQLQNLPPAQKYDCAMRLFERGLGPSEASRILKVNKGSLQHYKDGKRKRPRSEGIPSPEVTPHGVFQENFEDFSKPRLS